MCGAHCCLNGANLSDPSAGPVLVAMVTAALSVLRGCEGCVHMLFSSAAYV